MSAAHELPAPSPIEDGERRGIGLPDIASAAPDLVLAVAYLAAWVSPEMLPAGTATWLLSMMVFEFIVIHSAGMMGTIALAPMDRDMKVKQLRLLGAVYLIFGLGLSLAFKSIWPLVSLTLQVTNRFSWAFFGQAPVGQERLYHQRSWAVGALLYLGGAFATTLLPVPRLGITPEVRDSFHLDGSGLWIDQPWRLMAFGFLYFAGTGLSELVRHRWLPASGIPKQS
jgi:hypothetical protein